MWFYPVAFLLLLAGAGLYWALKSRAIPLREETSPCRPSVPPMGGGQSTEERFPWGSAAGSIAVLLITIFAGWRMGAVLSWPVLSQFGFALVLWGITFLLLKRVAPDPAVQPLRRKLARVILIAGTWAMIGTTVVALQVWGALPLDGPAALAGLLPVSIGLAYGAGKSAGLTRSAGSDKPGSESARPDPRFVKAGLFYANPTDPAVFVPRRLGVGWTLNFANPWAWVFLVSVLTAALTFSFVIAAIILWLDAARSLPVPSR